ncbi:hypothetical protein JW899_03615 [Candidatus Uhrbacteria bacterium]|nr:hypothetical protein [Candidatus Uhrbacteria bacterium]
MWFYVAMSAVVGLSLGVMASIVLGKFPQLSLIDTESLPQEREAKRKKEIIRNRVGRRLGVRLAWLERKVSPVVEFSVRRFRQAHEKVARTDRRFWGKAVALIHPEERRTNAGTIVVEARKMAEAGKTAEAERKFIEAIAMDERYLDAYRGLGDLYMESRNYAQARETYEYLAKVSLRKCCSSRPQGGPPAHEASVSGQAAIAQDYLNLADACRSLGDIAGWRRALETVVEHEPSNPKHLDLLLEAHIAEGNRDRASHTLRLLEDVNPDNQKLPKLKKQVAEMGVGVGVTENKPK